MPERKYSILSMQKTKLLVIGPSTSGKTTIMNYLKMVTDETISESDDELIRLNEGTYPTDTAYKMLVLVPQMVSLVLSKSHGIFFTNTNYFTADDLRKARKSGFRILQLVLPRGEMEKRNSERVKNNGYDDLSGYFDEMLAYMTDIKERKLVDKEINALQPVEKITEQILKEINTH